MNRDRLAEELGFERSDIDMLVNLFTQNALTSLEKMQVMISQNNMKGIENAAHSIKGSAANLKMDDIFELCKNIEMRAKANENWEYERSYKELTEMIDTVGN